MVLSPDEHNTTLITLLSDSMDVHCGCKPVIQYLFQESSPPLLLPACSSLQETWTTSELKIYMLKIACFGGALSIVVFVVISFWGPKHFNDCARLLSENFKSAVLGLIQGWIQEQGSGGHWPHRKSDRPLQTIQTINMTICSEWLLSIFWNYVFPVY